jgi:hypothetical protein
VFANVSHYHSWINLQARLELTRVEPLMGLNSNGWLPPMSQNIRLGWKGFTFASTLAYYDTAKILP